MTGSNRLAHSGLAAALVLSALSCGDFAHTNPLDPVVPVTVQMSGPDSIFSYADTVTFITSSTPAYKPEAESWESRGKLPLISLGHGKFTGAPYTSAEQGVVDTIVVNLDGRIARKSLVFFHRAVTVRATDCHGARPVSMSFDQLGGLAYLCLVGVDAHGLVAPLGQPTVTASNPAVISIEPPDVGNSPWRVHSRVEGSSLVRFSVAGMNDSVTVTVRQRVASVGISPSGCGDGTLRLAVGDSVQLSPSNLGWDPGGSSIADTARVRAASQGMTFREGYGVPGYISVSPTGLVKGLKPANEYVFGTATSAVEGIVSGGCRLVVY